MATLTPSPPKSITINTVEDEKFAEIHTGDEINVRVEDDGRIFESLKFGACACAVGIHSYSSGTHSIRIKVHWGIPILGIRSRDIPPVSYEELRGSYGADPSTYGFGKDAGRVFNGRMKLRQGKDMRIDRTDIVFTLIINCDEHRLSLIDEGNGERDEVEVDILSLNQIELQRKNMATPTPTPSKSITVNTVMDEKFAEIHTSDEINVRVEDNGRTFTNLKFGACACAVGIHSYSSGTHSIRIKVHRGIAILGIRSRNIPPVAYDYLRGNYGGDPSTYGFETGLGRVFSGQLDRRELLEIRIGRSDIVFTLIINCDEHRLSLIDEGNGERDEVEVDASCAPFPWCLFIVLPQTTTRVALI
ncbi:unnamed protein product [Adineta steineri]|uniref:Uncharacterized protein n=1 Tax=Adineta steineri TaxID=433720 RepID=A0A819BC78_9BILA|nr:unnamed protein product [Adineta steineri]